MNNPSIRLLRSAFCRDGKVMCSGVDTDQGTARHWLELERKGLVTRMNSGIGGALGHRFAFRITPQGEAVANNSNP